MNSPKINWKRGLHRIYIVLVTVYYLWIFIWIPLAAAHDQRNFAITYLKIGDKAGFEKSMDQATFQAQFPILVHDIFRDPFEAFLGLVAVPALFYVIPLLFILLIRWIWRGFSQDSPKKAEQGAAANP